MAKFCVKCRSQLEPDANFCDECGEPVRARHTAGAAQAVPVHVYWRKAGIWGGVGVAALIVVGGVAASLAMPPSNPSASDITKLLNASASKVADATCLDNFPYEKNPVVVGGFDTNTQQWMQLLSRAGIYGPPQPVTNAFLFGGGRQYSHTPAGGKKIHNGKLCFADGLTVSAVQFSKPVKIDQQWHTQGSYSYAYRNADAWIQTPEAQRVMPDRFADLPKTSYVSLVKGEHGWQLDNGKVAGGGPYMQGAMQSTMDGRFGARGGLFSKITELLSRGFGSRPVLIGTWTDESGARDTVEFTPDSAILQGHGVPVTYEKDRRDNKQIHVLTGTGVPLATVEFIDHDHFFLSIGFVRTRFHRIG